MSSPGIAPTRNCPRPRSSTATPRSRTRSDDVSSQGEHQRAADPVAAAARDKEIALEPAPLDEEQDTAATRTETSEPADNVAWQETAVEESAADATVADDTAVPTNDWDTVPTFDEPVVTRPDAEPHPFFERPDPQPLAMPTAGEPRDLDPVVVPSAEVSDEWQAGGGAREQDAVRLPMPRSAPPVDGQPALWEAGVTDTGAATAQLPEQQTSEPELDPVQQQIVTVAAWLADAEEAGEKLSGAEVARRLGVSARTGQRRLDKATEHLAEQRRQQGRAHLRSVRT
ncbi:hypothetical protein ACGFMM_34365 [Streptomyces sp. NPDC048604]|uniref:hypothetical protein n=1 Tax=Streptomyces sp. NPDC048604 TaxID=3365578 RepID=UPI0037102E68